MFFLYDTERIEDNIFNISSTIACTPRHGNVFTELLRGKDRGIRIHRLMGGIYEVCR
jgi:hypothetical protein